MTATTSPRSTQQLDGNPLPVVNAFPIKADEVLYQGTLCMIDSSGLLRSGAAATGCIGVGKIDNNEPVTDATGLADGDKFGTVYPGCWAWNSGTTADLIQSDDVGKLCYIIDNQTVGLTDGGATRSLAGTIYGVNTNGQVYVYSNLAPGVDGTALAAEIAARLLFQSDLASTANAKGASLVGIEDSAGYFAAATVEAALVELTEEPFFSVSCPIAALSTVADADVLMRFKPLFKCKIVGMSVQATTAVTTGAKATTLTPKIGGVSVTGGVCALTSANLNAKGAAVYGTAVTAANAVSASAEVTVVASATTTFVEGAANVTIFFGRA